MSEHSKNSELKSFPAIISSLRSPLSMFGLAMLICNAVFSLSAAVMGDLTAFIYAIHTFLGIVLLFVLIALWSPKSLYHPSDLIGLDKELPEVKNAREIVTIVIVFSLFAYAGYQIYKLNKLNTDWNTTNDWAMLIRKTGNNIDVEGATKIDVQKAKQLHDRNIKFIDVDMAHSMGHIPNAYSLH